MNPPFVLAEDLDVSVYTSLTDLTGHVEAQDVRDGVYEAFDAEGRIVILTAGSDRGRVLAAPGDVAEGRLRDVLIAHLAAIGRQQVATQATGETPLKALIELVVRSQEDRSRRW